MIDQAIVTTLKIARMGERKNFQIFLPRNVKAIVGMEYGAFRGAYQFLPAPEELPGVAPQASKAFQMGSNKIMGRLTMHVPDIEGIFYQEDLREFRNIQWGEVIAVKTGVPNLWIHAGKKAQTELRVDSPVPFIEGSYIDSWGTDEFTAMAYTLHLYTWLELKAP
jgi:hypothetical protein